MWINKLLTFSEESATSQEREGRQHRGECITRIRRSCHVPARSFVKTFKAMVVQAFADRSSTYR